METVLSIDASQRDAHITTLEVQEGKLKVVESRKADLLGLFHDLHQVNSISEQFSSEVNGEEESTATGAEESLVNGEAQSESVSSDSEVLDSPSHPGEQVLRDTLLRFRTSWSNVSLIVPPIDYLSLNLALPFIEERAIARVIRLEVQDLIPFDLSDFTLDYRIVGRNDDGTSDVHVSLVPKKFVKDLLRLCRSVGIEPEVLTTPSSSLGAFYYLSRENIAENCVLLQIQEEGFDLLTVLKGKVRRDRSIRLEHLSSHHPEEPEEGTGASKKGGNTIPVTELLEGVPGIQEALIRELRLTILSAIEKYGERIDRVYLIGESTFKNELQRQLALPVEVLNPESFLQTRNRSIGLSGVAGAFALRESGYSPLINFRTGEFAYSPYLRIILDLVKRLIPYLALTLIVAMGLFVVTYFARSYHIGRLEKSLGHVVQETLGPTANVPDEDQIGFLAEKRQELLDHLESLGSPARLTPSDALVHLSKEFAKAKKRAASLSLGDVTITSEKITLTGRAGSLSDIETLVATLRQKRKVFCRVEPPRTGGSGTTRTFTVEVGLCE